MAGAGKKLSGNGARRKARSPSASVTDGGYGRPPHPTRAHAGQRYWPRGGRRRRSFVVSSVGRDGYVLARRDEGAREAVRITASRLLATRGDGQGRHFQFLGWSSRRYRTWARVMVLEGQTAVLILPEWHPRRPVALPARLLPQSARAVGARLVLSADLSAPVAGKLGLAAPAARSRPSGLKGGRFA